MLTALQAEQEEALAQQHGRRRGIGMRYSMARSMTPQPPLPKRLYPVLAAPSRLKHALPIGQGYLLATKSHTYLQQLLDMPMRSYLGPIAFGCYLG